MKTIREIREALHLTQVEMANRLGITRNYLALIETGRRSVPEKVKEIASELCNNVTETNDVTESPHVNQTIAELTSQMASMSARLDALDARLATIEKLLLRLVADGGGGQAGS